MSYYSRGCFSVLYIVFMRKGDSRPISFILACVRYQGERNNDIDKVISRAQGPFI